MANMSYCRFRNTKLDLSDCLEALSSCEGLSYHEAISGKAMFREFLEFCQENGIIDDFDSDVIDDLFLEREENNNGF